MRPTKFHLTVLLVVLGISNMSWAKPYVFTFKMSGETFEYKKDADSKDEAFEYAAKACYQHFKGGKKLTESKGLDIIDVCANPKA